MTVQTTTSRWQYETNGTTGPWTVGSYFLAASDLVVTHTDDEGVDSVLTLDVDYEVTGAGDPSGGTVTTTDSYAAGGLVTIVNDPQPLQETDYSETDSFPAASHERALDLLTMLIQRLGLRVERSIRVADTEDAPAVLPPPAERALKLLGFDADGNYAVSAPTSGSAADLALQLASNLGANLLGFLQTYPYTSGTAGYHMAQFRSLLGAGCAGDGSTNDYVNLSAAFATGIRHEGGNRVYKCNSRIQVAAGVAVKLWNATLDFSGVSAPYGSETQGLYISGSKGTSTLTTADCAAGALTVTVADASGISADQFVLFESTRVWNGSTPVTFITKVRSKSGSTLTFAEQLPYAMAMADGAKITPLNLLSGVELVNVRIIGQNSATIFNAGGQSLNGVRLDYCFNPKIDHFSSKDVNYAAIVLSRSVNVSVVEPDFDTARSFGLAYGIVVADGCYNVRIASPTGRSMRHIVAHGGSGGINRKTSVTNFIGDDMIDASIDAHAGQDGLVINGGIHNTSPEADGSAGKVGDGLISQGANFSATNVVINNPLRHGIFHQPFGPGGGSTNIAVFTVRRSNVVPPVTTTFGVCVSTESAGAVSGVFIGPGVLIGGGSIGIGIEAQDGDISGISISGVEASQFLATNAAMRIRAYTGRTVSKPKVSNSSFKSSFTRVVYFLTDAGGTMTDAECLNVTSDGNSVANIAVSMTGVTRGRIVGTNALNCATAIPYETTNTTGLHAPDIPNNAQTIAAGVVTLGNTGANMLTVDTEAAGATDDLDTLNGGLPNQVISVVAANSARTVVLKDGTGNLRLAGDFSLDNVEDAVLLQKDAGGTFWRQLTTSNSGT